MSIQLCLVSILHVFNDGYQAAFLLLLPFIARDLHINLTQIGMLGSVIGFMETTLAFPAGYLGSKFDKLKLLIILLAIFATGFIGLMMVNSFIVLLIPFLCIGVAYGLFHPLAFSLVAEHADKRYRGRILGDFTAVGEIGRMLFAALVTFLAVKIGWRSTTLAYGVSAIVMFCIAFVTIYNHKKCLQKLSEQKDTSSFLGLLKNKLFLVGILAAVLDSMASSTLFLFLPFLLIKKGINPAVIGSFAAAFFLGNLLGKSFVGRLSDLFNNSTVFIVTEFFMAVSIVLLVGTNSFIAIIIVSIILGILTKGTVPTRVSMIIETVEKHGKFDKAVSMSAFFVSFGASFAPLLFGRIADVWGIQYTFYTSAAFALLAIIPAMIFRYMKMETKNTPHTTPQKLK